MSEGKNVEASELIVASGPISDASLSLSEKDMEKEGIPSNSISSAPAGGGGAMSGNKMVNQPSALEQGVYYPPTSCYDYYYPGYNGSFGQPDDKGYYNAAGASYTGIQSDNNSLLYYYPGYPPYQTGTDYLQQPCSYGSDAFPCYSYDSAYSGNVSNVSTAAARSGSAKPVMMGPAARSGSAKPVMMGPSDSGKSNGYNAPKTNSNFSSKVLALPSSSKLDQSSNFSKSIYQNQHLKPLNKSGSSFQTTGLMKGYHSTSKVSPFANRNPGIFMQYSPVNYQSDGRAWNNNYRYKSRETMSKTAEFKALTELTRGPRSDTRKKSPQLAAAAIGTEKYNSHEFHIEYDNAKFYVIKSYSEDDVHQCIKYDVWSSTPNGNKKLDAAFREADAETSETGKKCPIFLFFSVNGSGQFVGLAEMIGQVDFSKNMDFWQLDKWSGFFPIKWHIIKDVPNTILRHIILENNENRPVTHSRDTQEIGLKQGLEMLSIFKTYSERTSVLDDFSFYENREKSLKAKRDAKPASQVNSSKDGDYKKHFERTSVLDDFSFYENREKSLKAKRDAKPASQVNSSKDGDYKKHFKARGGIGPEQTVKTSQSDPSSLISLTKKLSINSQPLKSSI